MTKYMKGKWMAFADIFKDDNTINEKAVVGFISFAIMVLYALISVVGNLMGYNFPINETIYGSFVTVTLGSFGIATVGQAVDNFSKNRNTKRVKTSACPKKPKVPIKESQADIDEYKTAQENE